MSRHTRADDRRQPPTEVLDIARLGAAEAQPGLLDRVVGFARRPEQPVGDRPEMGPVRLEPFRQLSVVVHRHILPSRSVRAMTYEQPQV